MKTASLAASRCLWAILAAPLLAPGHNAGHMLAADSERNRADVSHVADAGFPFRVRFTPDGTRVIVSLPESASLAAVGPNPMPTSIAISPDSTTAYVIRNKPPQIVAIEIASGNITARHIPMGTTPDGLAAGTIID